MNNRKYTLIIAFSLLALVSFDSCKALAKTAVKYWTKKQVKEFVQNCETKSSKLIGEANASKFCDCAVDKVAEQYKNYEEAKTVSVTEIIKLANECR